MTTREPNSFLKQLRENWMFILFIGGLIIGWTDVQDRLRQSEITVQNQQSDIAALTIKVEANEATVATVAGDIKAIKASLSFIEARIK